MLQNIEKYRVETQKKNIFLSCCLLLLPLFLKLYRIIFCLLCLLLSLLLQFVDFMLNYALVFVVYLFIYLLFFSFMNVACTENHNNQQRYKNWHNKPKYHFKILLNTFIYKHTCSYFNFRFLVKLYTFFLLVHAFSCNILFCIDWCQMEVEV